MKNRPAKTPATSADQTRWIDLNCDVGESTGEHIVGNDNVLIPLVTSANIACGGHAGDRNHISNAVQVAVKHGVTVGAHPGYPDRANFGRQAMDLSEQQLGNTLRQQLEFLAAITDVNQTFISYVKPHGALYHRCNTDPIVARVVAKVAREFGSSMSIMGQTGTKIEEVCKSMTVPFIREAYADRRYLESGRLAPRDLPNAVITNAEAAASQVVSIAVNQTATTNFNHQIQVIGDSICIHGDNPNAAEILRIARIRLTAAEVVIGTQKLPERPA